MGLKNAAQFIRSLLNIADYVQIKNNNEVGNVTWNLTVPIFTYLNVPQGMIEVDKEGEKIRNESNEMEVFMWH